MSNAHFEADFSALHNLSEDIDLAAREAITEMAQAQVVNVQMRLQRGIGLNDKEMPKYAASTAKQRRSKRLQTRVRDLSDTGMMRKSIHVESVEKDGDKYVATLGFSTRAEAEKAAYNQKIAPFFGISPQDERDLQSVLQASIERTVNARSKR